MAEGFAKLTLDLIALGNQLCVALEADGVGIPPDLRQFFLCVGLHDPVGAKAAWPSARKWLASKEAQYRFRKVSEHG